MTEAPLLAVDNLRVEFAARRVVHAVRGLSYTIAPGETLGLVGESGSGKSVSALALLGLLPKRVGRITAGSVRFEGREQTGRRAARHGRNPDRTAPRGRLPTPVQRRHAPAGDDRDGPGLRASAPDRGRADDRARRHDPCPDSRSPRPPPCGPKYGCP